MSKVSTILLITILFVVLLLCAWVAMVEASLVFNKSYRGTMDALGEPHAVSELWATFYGSIAVGIVVIGALAITVRRKIMR